MLTIRNLDLILIVCEALDISLMRDLTSYNLYKDNLGWPILTSLEIFRIRQQSKLRLKRTMTYISYRHLSRLIYLLKSLIEEELLRIHIEKILKAPLDNTRSEIFLRRFRILFRQYYDDKAIGINRYYDDTYINQLGMINLYMLYMLKQDNGFDFLFSYLTKYDFLK
uniref:Uncharacterized protein n=1 Tax=Bangiopsis subsimplex TaxID=139980 RepID=A0A1Y9TLH7_9RHOD|nr:hypothetical protein [Bangiopsis subsimplex]